MNDSNDSRMVRLPVRKMSDEPAPQRAAQEGDLPEPVGILQEEAFGRGVVMWIKKPGDGTNLYTADQLRTAIAAAGGGVPQGWISLEEQRPEPEVFVLAWDGKKVTVDWWGSLYRPHGTEYTHWMPFPTPPGVSGRSMYGMHSLASSPQPAAAQQWVPCRCFDDTSRRLCVNKDRCSRTEAYNAPAVAPAQGKPDRTGMTYYKNNDCKAASADDVDCICWTPAQAAPSAGEVERAAHELLRTLDHGAYPREDIDLDLVRLVCDAALSHKEQR